VNWIELVENPQSISSLFRITPSLVNVRVKGIVLDEGGPTVSLSIVLNEFPTDPPPRWKRDLANAVVLDVELLGVQSVTISGWTILNVASFRLEREQSGTIVVQAMGTDFNLRCSCGWIRVNRVSPYQQVCGRDYA